MSDKIKKTEGPHNIWREMTVWPAASGDSNLAFASRLTWSQCKQASCLTVCVVAGLDGTCPESQHLGDRGRVSPELEDRLGYIVSSTTENQTQSHKKLVMSMGFSQKTGFVK